MEDKMKERFLEEIKDHQIEIIKDDGLYKHLRLKRPGTYCMCFDIITYPGGLLYRGDVGTFVFERTEDMMEFFRHPKGELSINTGYWSEKVKAESIFGGGIKKFDSEIWKKRLKSYWKMYFEDDSSSSKAQKIWMEIQSQILTNEDSEWEWTSNLMSFDVSDIDQNFGGWDMLESLGSGKKYTWHYIWCCYALSWAVIQYDKCTVTANV